MNPDTLAEQLILQPDEAAQRAFLLAHAAALDDSCADALKAQADGFLRSDVQRSLQAAELLRFLAELTGQPSHRALSLLAEANALSIGGLGEYSRAVELYDEAAEIYRACGRPAEQARSQVGKVFSLGFLGRNTEAFESGEWASRVLEEHAQWRPLAALTMNLATIYDRLGEDAPALVMLDRARDYYARLGAAGDRWMPLVEGNRAIVLRNLGRFEASVEASQQAHDLLARSGQAVEAARAHQNLAVTYYVLGRYNEALALLDEVRAALAADGRHRDVSLLDLFTSDCLLRLRRFAEALDKCRQARSLFSELGTDSDAAQALLNESVALAGLGHANEAMTALREARTIFAEEPNPVWMAHADLHMAALLLSQGRVEESLAVAGRSADLLRGHDLPVAEAEAHLAEAQAQLGLGHHAAARASAEQALATAQARDLPVLLHRGYHILAKLAEAAGQTEAAQTHCARAIAELERLRGRLMVEHRSGFLEDKEILYQDMVCLCLELRQPDAALNYAERAKSRALVDLLAYHLDLDVQPRDARDRPLTERLARLRAERDRLHRRRLAEVRLEGRGSALEDGGGQQVLDLERQITEVWHQLLVRRADYASDAALYQVRTEPFQPYLPPDTLLLEWFIARGRPVLFLVTADEIRALRLPAEVTMVAHLMSLLWLNLGGVRGRTAEQAIALSANARRLLGQLYTALIAPAGDFVAQFPRLIVVPHGPLHYLPFHALHDGRMFLIERHEISYLPGASLLGYRRPSPPDASGMLALGYSFDGRLPFAVEEAQSVAEIFDGELYAEDAATVAQLRATGAGCRVLHLATHGDFRSDNPLFSGLALADGWLSTLDCFSLRLRASLVTLSACQTGLSVVGGGDELLGLTRALLAAGTSSLLLSLWAVEDASTALWMTAFYTNLAAGCTKGEAVRRTQLGFIRGTVAADPAQAAAYAHPFFWAPFYLVGDSGPL
jgi:tetratricopeptide (TPR) repeat protein